MTHFDEVTSTDEGASGQAELSVVVIDNPHSANECILYPSDATDEELETMWVRAKEGDYTSLENFQ